MRITYAVLVALLVGLALCPHRGEMSTHGQVFFDGNSLTVGSGSTGGFDYPNRVMARIGGGWWWRNVAVSGTRTPDLDGRAPTAIDARWDAGSAPHVVVIWEITNDLKLGASRAAAYQNIVTYCRRRKAAGWKVIVLTVLPRTQVGLPATFEADRQAINAELRQHWRDYADALVDVGANPTLGPDGSQANLTYYWDGIHLTDAGYAVVAGMVAPALEAVLEGAGVAGGPIFPRSSYPVTTSRVFPNFHAATNAHTEGLGYEASLGADSIWRLWFQMPPTLPTGTMKLLLRVISAGAGNVKLNPKWKSFGSAETVSSPSLNAEGVATITTVADQFIETKITLDADTPVAGEEVILDLVGETSGWTLASVSTAIASIIWE